MNRELSQEELVERWTLAPSELVLLMNKTGPGRLGFAALLKFFQAEGRFPGSKSDVPAETVEYLLRQTKVPPSSWAEYDWQGRTIKYHRAEIRSLFGFREATVEDCEAVMSWLREHLLGQERHPERILEVALQRFRALKIEPPTAGRLDRMLRMLRSTLQTFEEDFGKQLFDRLPPKTIARLDALLETPSPESAGVPLHDLRADPGPVSIETGAAAKEHRAVKKESLLRSGVKALKYYISRQPDFVIFFSYSLRWLSYLIDNTLG